MNWIKVLDEGQLPNGERIVVDVGERSVLLIHHEGTIYALESRCPHMRGPLSRGTVETLTEGPTITCPWHRSAFDLRTGDVRDWSPWPPAVGVMLGALRRKRALVVYPVKVEQGEIWVDVADDGAQETGDK